MATLFFEKIIFSIESHHQVEMHVKNASPHPCCQTHTNSKAIFAQLWIVKQSSQSAQVLDNSFNTYSCYGNYCPAFYTNLNMKNDEFNFLLCIIKCGLHGIIFFLSRKSIQLEILLF